MSGVIPSNLKKRRLDLRNYNDANNISTLVISWAYMFDRPR